MRNISDQMIIEVIELFDRGLNTADMARKWSFWPEADYERALHLGLERRRVQRVAEAIGANV